MHVSKSCSLASKRRPGRTVGNKRASNCCNMTEMMPSISCVLLQRMNFVFTMTLRQNKCFRMEDRIMSSVKSELSVVRNKDNLDCHLYLEDLMHPRILFQEQNINVIVYRTILQCLGDGISLETVSQMVFSCLASAL